jgi:hypothetical protein
MTAPIQDLSTMQVAFKFQAGVGTPATGIGAYGLDVLPSTGLAVAISAIESALIKRNRMKRRPRHGMRSSTAAYETELSVGPCDPIFEAVLGTNVVPQAAFTNADWGAVTLTGTGTIATFATGTLVTDGIVAGNMIRFTGLGTPGNNGVWVPVIAVTNGVATLAPGYLVDEGAAAAYSVDVARYYATGAQYVDRYASVEEYMPDAVISKYGTDMRFHSLSVSVAPKEYVRVAVALTGRDMTMLSALTVPTAPALPTPTYIERDSLILLDGGIYVNGIRRGDLTSLRFGIAANANATEVIGSRTSPNVSLGQFAFTGDFASLVSDGTDFGAFDAEDDISVLLHCKEKDTQAFVSFYIGFCSFGGYSTPAGGEGNLVQTMSLYGGEDERGAGYAPTIILISAADA